MARKAKDSKRRKIGERTEIVAIKLTPMQIEDQRARVIDLLQAKDELEEKLASVKADYKAKIADVDSQKADALGKIRSGREQREMTIEEYVDERNEVIKVDKATGEELGRRTATARELQEELPLPPPATKADAPIEDEAKDDGDDNLEAEVAADDDADDFGSKDA